MAGSLLFLVLAGAAVYARTLGVPFLLADHAAIVTNLRIRELWPGPFTSAQPVTDVSLALDYAVFGPRPAGFHAVNVALHLACGLLLFDVARRTLRMTRTLPGREATAAWWAALVFLLHPLATEAVTYVSGRGELLAALALLGVLELVLLAEVAARGRAPLRAAALACCALGMGVTPAMLAAPLAVLWLGRCVLPRADAGHLSFASERAVPASAGIEPRRWPLHLGLAAVAAAALYLAAVRGLWAFVLAPDVAPLAYLRTQLGVTWYYLRLLLWPAGQTVEHEWPLAASWLAPEVLVPAAGWIVLLGALVWLERSGRRAAAFWLGLAVLTLLPTSSVVPHGDLVRERRMYLPTAGFSVLAALALVGAAARVPRVAAAVGTLVVAALAVTTLARNEVWRDPLRFWEDALAKAPTRTRVFRELTRVHEERGDRVAAARVAAAEAHMLEGLRRVRPHDAHVVTTLAESAARRGRFPEALAWSSEAVRLVPDDAVARAIHGAVLLQTSRPEEARVQLEMAETLARGAPGRVDGEVLRSIQTNLGWAYALIGREKDALRVLRRAAADDDVTALNNLGTVLGRLGDWNEALAVLERAHAVEPGDAEVKSNLGWVYANLGRLQQASAILEQAILQRPSEPSAHGNLGWVRLRAGDPAHALHALAMAQVLQPENAWIAQLQGAAHALLGEWRPAVAAFERALVLDPASSLTRDNLDRARRHELPSLPETPVPR
jgi:Flp pilus assembly protein TadD